MVIVRRIILTLKARCHCETSQAIKPLVAPYADLSDSPDLVNSMDIIVQQ